MKYFSKLFISEVISIENIKQIVQSTLYEYNNISCYLFGSYAKGTPTVSSDVDLLLIFDKDKYDPKLIQHIREKLQKNFELRQKYSMPIYGYINSINEDGYILYRQYINYGILLYGQDVRPHMNNESEEELKVLEYEKYWTFMHNQKIEMLEYLLAADKKIDQNLIVWQYLFLATYWYAKAQLTLENKQHSLNRYTLEYIYDELLNIPLSEQQKYSLRLLQKYRDIYKCGEYLEYGNGSFYKHFEIIKKLSSNK